MARYIDADAFMKEVVKIQDLRRLSTKTIGEALDRTPTADVVEVIRCEDCRYWDNRFDVMVCNLTDGMKGASDYCSCGERRKE